MTIGSLIFNGDMCKIVIEQKGGTPDNANGSEAFDARITNVDITGFQRNLTSEKTFGTYLYNDSGYSPADIQIDFLYDIGSPVTQMVSFVGSTYNNVARNTVLKDKRVPALYKLKLEFNEYKTTFGTLNNGDEALRLIFYNAYGVNIQTRPSVDGPISGTLRFRVNPFNLVGSSNYLELEKSTSVTVAGLNTAESDYDTIMGY